MPISLHSLDAFCEWQDLPSKHYVSKKLALRSVICLCCRSSTFSAAHEGPNHHFWALFGHPPPPPPENRTLVCHCQGQPSFFLDQKCVWEWRATYIIELITKCALTITPPWPRNLGKEALTMECPTLSGDDERGPCIKNIH